MPSVKKAPCAQSAKNADSRRRSPVKAAGDVACCDEDDIAGLASALDTLNLFDGRRQLSKRHRRPPPFHSLEMIIRHLTAARRDMPANSVCILRGGNPLTKQQADLMDRENTVRDEMYGEISPRLVARIMEHCSFKAGPTFLDLGSGIGQVVLTVAALEPARCTRVVGVEKLKQRAECCAAFHANFTKDPFFAASKTMPEIGFHTADFLTSPEIAEWVF